MPSPKTLPSSNPSPYSTMLQSQIQSPNYFPPETPSIFPPTFGPNPISNPPPPHLTRLLPTFPLHDFPPGIMSSNSTSDEADVDERRQRRMISNRESARRSRMRKQRQLDELWSQVVCLRMENHDLLDKLNRVCESHDRVVRENSELKEEAADLRRMLVDLQVRNSETAFGDFEEVLPCSSHHGRSESA